jgi:regulator of sigma E protease
MFLEILRVLGICLEVLIIFNLLIVVHELGHFLAARWRGLVVEEFGIWFGKPLWKKKIGSVVCGFVKLPQLAPMEAIEGETGLKPEELPPVKPVDKIIVALAGPVFSFLLAVLFAFAVWMIGRPVPEREATTTVGEVMPGSPAAVGGLRSGDVIVAVDGHKVTRFQGSSSGSIVWRVVRSEGATIPVVYRRNGVEAQVDLVPQRDQTEWWQRRATRSIGISPAWTPMVADVVPGSPAALSRLQKNDMILRVNGNTVYGFSQIEEAAEKGSGADLMLDVDRSGKTVTLALKPAGPLVKAVTAPSPASEAGLKPNDRVVEVNGSPVYGPSAVSRAVTASNGKPIAMVLLRGTERVSVTITPRAPQVISPNATNEKENPKVMIGVVWGNHAGIQLDDWGAAKVVHSTPWEQIITAATSIFATLDAVFSPKSDIGAQHLGGPVTMMRTYYRLFESPWGWQLALWFSVMLNVNLAIMNMLPFPVLDGGHVVLATAEAVRGKPLNARFLTILQNAFAFMLIGFMLFVTFYDLGELLHRGDPRMKFGPPSPPAQVVEPK